MRSKRTKQKQQKKVWIWIPLTLIALFMLGTAGYAFQLFNKATSTMINIDGNSNKEKHYKREELIHSEN
ncbi:hypothetical protein ABET41_18420 [Metabacillus fastidiosus]|uniref:Uncharacterized protein n=1 Tax=Metabacillus fastidiosus TaxID=1458 RepID=A0ABU6P4R8_9BACI|nr:hypothetical protein [Metabacillus fastidiosus]MED4403923.1 hypothetical protein [Metabacillus fastidiosus]MED4464467.1 hypothetical protein [Metabacillus fastidiosus]